MVEKSKPGKIELPDGTYRVMVLQVVESDGQGPRVFRRLRDEESVKVEEGMEFWIVYASEKVLDARKPN